jgi:hypothetical protein
MINGMSELPPFDAGYQPISYAEPIRRIADTLHAVTEPTDDATFGGGAVFTLWDTAGITLEWFPAADVLRCQTPEMKILLRRLGEPLVGQEQVIFSREDARGILSHFALTRLGALTLLQVPTDAEA